MTMTGSSTAQTAFTGDEAMRQWRLRGAGLDAKIVQTMRVTMALVAIVLATSAIWVVALR